MEYAGEGQWDATCTTCTHTMMDQEWETDAGPDETGDIRFCPMCGEQALAFSTGAESRNQENGR